ncbi:hypothetical protein BTO06_00250 [Tenacibaculum sp. SZ-18]|uniref:hypothetical protein n=1 Tax=Tenacibaculum sp. SZ-18 TaxID=754423 RepID=UPI000C2D1B98|nr:hypothetical protein [Tenacibaculum sp. SZ-18]AUC13668.1 hypothetical protein BTO06_00250 [Tenacibaculum sp. SZ-18]
MNSLKSITQEIKFLIKDYKLGKVSKDIVIIKYIKLLNDLEAYKGSNNETVIILRQALNEIVQKFEKEKRLSDLLEEELEKVRINRLKAGLI